MLNFPKFNSINPFNSTPSTSPLAGAEKPRTESGSVPASGASKPAVPAELPGLPDTLTLGSDVKAIDSLQIQPENVQAGAPFLNYLTQTAPNGEVLGGPQGGGIQRPEGPAVDTPPVIIGSVPGEGKDALRDMIEAMKASLRQVE
ncbi:hypothetical protein COW36_06020 [bacterium (Candidatus Blackallbacteria) CG17_big_fil_post_rev_8_21_14_2_50_48_46]|uniref:Uncharacterized protein n=1 Tax=bacterium (Candidatus Blackallbacteria) CG17_big_fil_post_rev_8_21_14_2_50_48_46 TaxID=2014261 RepID=A0A2M7G7M7_9BACT|nr:MAG: hypothetical protein COW64_16850 [bacterium (Candidatus Blackallbacteria) CG18_big_fil_WC_8_21_14_2_50_49_26]PIW18085.1 MAG: hypothetical protein COW36_06020 [bacterium (Candidatus Blackallbacteria) CG17_big_fil_post_rev_8_21_14_2_50_48_46]PIW51094.1 MAG: hypothetical protein COW20_00170 [bacterium (Candidatus Blackallbacteria) CG13_big_fil_rev_8_21_14_2_50_49_14]